jgi:hypothetical protein
MSWSVYNNGQTLGTSGSERGEIIDDIEHSAGARITLEKDGSIAPFAVTLGVYGLMFHTHFSDSDQEAKAFIQSTKDKINMLFLHLNIPETVRGAEWENKYNDLLHSIAEQ